MTESNLHNIVSQGDSSLNKNRDSSHTITANMQLLIQLLVTLQITTAEAEPEPSPKSRQLGALRLCGWNLRSCRGGLTFKFDKNSTNF